MNAGKPLVSVILPVYNVEPYLQETLDCLLRQSLTDLEVIIVEDGSTDGSRGIVEQAERDGHTAPHIRAIYHPTNQGVAAARNTGVKAAQGKYIAFVDGDDLPRLDMYGKMVAAAQEQDVDIVTCGYSRFREGEREDPVPVPFRYPVARRIAGSALKSLLQRGHRDRLYWYNQLYMYSRDLFDRESLRFDPDVPLGSDSVFNAQALHGAHSLYAIPEHLYVIRQRLMSITSHGKPEWNTRVNIQYQALRRFYESKGLWSSSAPDYFRYVLEFSLPQAIANSCMMATSRKELVGMLQNLRAQDWVSDALQRRDVSGGLPFKKSLVSKLLAHNMLRLVALLYSPRIQAKRASNRS